MTSLAAIQTLLHEHATGAYFARLVHHPTPHRLRTTPELVYHATVNEAAPQFTVVMPAYNHAGNIQDAIAAAAASASLPFDVIVVDDGSDDGTAARARTLLESRPLPSIARATIIRNPVPAYETACDNLGFALAQTEVIIEVQADIQIRERGFDALLLRALATSPQPSAISGRCGHAFQSLRAGSWLRSTLRRRAGEAVGLCGRAIETPEIVDAIKGRIYRCETVNRGPWLLLKSNLERHGYLDERHFFLGNDDHDYHRRLFEEEGRRPLYVPMSLHAPLAHGAVRRRRTGLNLAVFNTLKDEKRGSPGFHHFLASLTSSSLPEPLSEGDGVRPAGPDPDAAGDRDV